MLLMAALNMHRAEWDSPFPSVRYSSYLSLAILLTFNGLTLLLFFYYAKNKANWKKPEF